MKNDLSDNCDQIEPVLELRLKPAQKLLLDLQRQQVQLWICK